MPGAYPPGWMPPGGPGVSAQQPRTPLPRWFVYAVAGLVVVGLLLVWLTGSDWANGGVRAGIAALVVAVIVLVAFLVRYVRGFRSTRTVSIALASVLLLVIVGAAGLALQSPIHSFQGSALDGQNNFASAITEFSEAHDNLGIARTYNDWGEYLLSKKVYSLPDDPTVKATNGDGALQKFEIVLNGYKTSTNSDIQNQVTRAENGFVQTVLAWGDASLAQKDYQGAVDRFNLVLNNKDTYSALQGFSQIHLDAAKAYYGLGQQQVTSGDCTDAVQTYQVIVTTFSDTPQGTQASNDLKKPQNVTGQVVDYTTQQPVGKVKLFLSKTWSVSSGFFSASNDVTVTSDSNGNFTFANITPGTTKYLISYINVDGRETIVVNGSTGQPANVVIVTPLCATSGVIVIYNPPAA